MAVVCTHAHDDHVTQAPALSDRFDAPVYLHPAEAPLWAMAHPDRKPDHDLCDGDVLTAGGIELQVITTPGHSPGSSCLYAPELATVFTGDTLFQGGPGATGRSFSSFETIIDSIRTRLLTLPADTTVRTGHGDSTSIGAEAAAPGGVDRAGALRRPSKRGQSSTSGATLTPWRKRRRSGSGSCDSMRPGTSPWQRQASGSRSPTEASSLLTWCLLTNPPRCSIAWRRPGSSVGAGGAFRTSSHRRLRPPALDR